MYKNVKSIHSFSSLQSKLDLRTLFKVAPVFKSLNLNWSLWHFCRNMLLLYYSKIIHNISLLQSIFKTAFSAVYSGADFSFDAEFSDGRLSVMVENYKQCFLNKMIKEKEKSAFVYCSILTISCLTSMPLEMHSDKKRRYLHQITILRKDPKFSGVSVSGWSN